MRQPKMTLPTQLVLHVLMGDPDREMYGLEICAEAGLASGTIHPILARLEKVGWLQSRWEDVDPAEAGRPRRRYYRLDPNSIGIVQSALCRSAVSVQALARLSPRVLGAE
ncbi:PadR family transcriptional regulator [Amycolatopsis sp. lyj-108]|uniref:PadR family transcriptional regulator n=1 Tax=Amycolatopsis sp. lyj-108 TaxID=2789286 RepID=UPI00397CBC26